MRRSLCSWLVLASLSVGGCDEGSEGEGEGPTPDDDRGVTLAIENGNVPAAPDVMKVAGLPGGGAVVATLDFSSGIVVAGLDADLGVVWTTTFVATGGVTDVVVDGDAIFVVVGQSGSALRVARLGLDGALVEVREFADLTRSARLLIDDGRFVFSADAEVAVYDADFRLVWAKTIAAQAAIVVDGDYVFAGAPLRNGANATGAEVTRTSKDGDVRYQQFISPGPGRHGVAGVGVVDGDLVVGVGNDVADARSTASLAPVVVARFDVDSGAPQGLLRLDVDAVLPDGRAVPLQFGGGLSAAVRGGTFLVGAVANSGALGDDVRTSSVFALAGTTLHVKTVGGAFTVVDDGAFVGVTNGFGGVSVTRVADIASGETCAVPLVGRVTTIEGTAVVGDGAVNDVAHVDGVVVDAAAAAAPTSTSTQQCSAGG